ncbi:MAG: hypothetical protein Q4G64_10595, partial [bacterium]|nr:hypothetical protein [bacterium]
MPRPSAEPQPAPARRRSPGSVVGALLAAGVAGAVGVGVARAARHRPLPTAELTFQRKAGAREVPSAGELGERLLRLCAHPTVAAPGHEGTDPAPFRALHHTMEELYPRLHGELECEPVGPHGTG